MPLDLYSTDTAAQEQLHALLAKAAEQGTRRALAALSAVPDILEPAAAAAYLQVSVKTVARWVEHHGLPVLVLPSGHGRGTVRRYRRRDLEAWLMTHRRNRPRRKGRRP